MREEMMRKVYRDVADKVGVHLSKSILDCIAESIFTEKNEIAYEQAKWTSVKDYLPKTSGNYLICTSSGGVYVTRFNTDMGIFSGRVGKIVTHWQPLPEATRYDVRSIRWTFAEGLARRKRQESKNGPVLSGVRFTARTYNCLRRAGIDCMEDLKKVSIQELASVRGMGQKSCREVVEKCNEVGINLKKGKF